MRLRVHIHCWFQVMLVLGIVNSEKVRYNRHKLYEIRLPSVVPSRVKREIDRHITLDQQRSEQNLNVTLLVKPDEVPRFENLLIMNRISHEKLNIELQKMIDNETKNIKPPNTPAGDFGWQNYYHITTIYEWLDYLADKYSDLITPLNLGPSHEGRPLKGVKLSHKADNPTVFIEAGIHAREWITTATATFLLNQLLTSTDARVQHIARNFNWIVFPVCNPDGYQHTLYVDRLWRKNRQQFGSCYGVDLNRNWNAFWSATMENAEDPCLDNYPGPYAFSEPETRKLAAYLQHNVNPQRIEVYLSFHSAAQKLLFPYSGKLSPPPNGNDLQKIGEKAIEALTESNGTAFETGNAAQMFYEAPGTSIDWVYGELNVSLVYAYELRRAVDKPFNFFERFLLPANQIEPAGRETLDSIVALLDEATSLGYFQPTSIRSFVVIYYSIGVTALLIVVFVGTYFAIKKKLCRRHHAADLNNILYHT